LGVGIGDSDAFSPARSLTREMQRQRHFAEAAFPVEERNGHGAPSP